MLEIALPTAAKQDEILNKVISQSVSLDDSDIFNDVFTVRGAKSTTYTTLLNVTGAGYFLETIISAEGNQANHGIRVTIDGVVIFEKTLSTTSGALAVCLQGYTYPSTTSLNYPRWATPFSNTTFDYSTGVPLYLLKYPLKFEKSLKVETLSPTATNIFASYKLK